MLSLKVLAAAVPPSSTVLFQSEESTMTSSRNSYPSRFWRQNSNFVEVGATWSRRGQDALGSQSTSVPSRSEESTERESHLPEIRSVLGAFGRLNLNFEKDVGET